MSSFAVPRLKTSPLVNPCDQHLPKTWSVHPALQWTSLPSLPSKEGEQYTAQNKTWNKTCQPQWCRSEYLRVPEQPNKLFLFFFFSPSFFQAFCIDISSLLIFQPGSPPCQLNITATQCIQAEGLGQSLKAAATYWQQEDPLQQLSRNAHSQDQKGSSWWQSLFKHPSTRYLFLAVFPDVTLAQAACSEQAHPCAQGGAVWSEIPPGSTTTDFWQSHPCQESTFSVLKYEPKPAVQPSQPL